ncbi:MAG: ATP-binding protein [Rhodospirillales bacterium]|nr:ATP-binding protein [Rhodospirillales bacterium]
MTVPSKLVNLLYRIADAANEATVPDDVLLFALDEVCAYMEWPIGHAYIEKERGSGELVSAGLWHLEKPEVNDDFRQLTEKTSFKSGVGLPGRVYKTGQPAWIPDVNEDPNFPRAKRSGEPLPVGSGFAFPVMTGRETTAVLEFFSENVEEMGDEVLDLMARVGTQLGRVIERGRAEEALKAREAYTKTILKNLAEGVITMDVKNGTIDMVNTIAETICGASLEDIQQGKAPLIANEEGKELEALGKYLTKNRSRYLDVGPIQVKAIKGDGTPFPLEFSLSSFAENDAEQLICVIRDITERKETERQLLHGQRMEAIGQMTGGIAHDFNNVLTAMLGNMQIVETLVDEHPQALGRTRAALTAGERAVDTTRRLLAFSRQQDLSLETVEVNGLVNETIKLIKQTFSSAIDIQTKLMDVPIYVHVDKSHLENAVINFAVNARDALEEGGRIVVQVGLEEVSSNKSEKFASISVQDNGVGIPDEILDRVFEPFFTTKDIGKGTGLGLSTVYGFAKQAGGDLVIKSKPGEGTNVTISLPLTDGLIEFEGKNDDSHSPIIGGSESILVVEDDPLVRDYAAAVLRSLGYKVAMVSDGREALSLLNSSEHPDLVFSDVVMPNGMSGWVLIEEIKEKWPDMKLMLATGWDEENEGKNNGTLLGVPLLRKPYSRKKLASAIRQVLDTQFPLHSS